MRCDIEYTCVRTRVPVHSSTYTCTVHVYYSSTGIQWFGAWGMGYGHGVYRYFNTNKNVPGSLVAASMLLLLCHTGSMRKQTANNKLYLLYTWTYMCTRVGMDIETYIPSTGTGTRVVHVYSTRVDIELLEHWKHGFG